MTWLKLPQHLTQLTDHNYTVLLVDHLVLDNSVMWFFIVQFTRYRKTSLNRSLMGQTLWPFMCFMWWSYYKQADNYLTNECGDFGVSRNRQIYTYYIVTLTGLLYTWNFLLNCCVVGTKRIFQTYISSQCILTQTCQYNYSKV